jgi:glycosyltransferase involved in cell wall biosynthesis
MSAVASFLKKVKSAFESEGHVVEFGSSTAHNSSASPRLNNSGGIKGLLKSILKKWAWLYQSIAYSGFFKRQDQLIELFRNKQPFDLVVEFHTVGSTLGKQLAEQWNAEFSVIFDSPVEEQFYEMHGTKTTHWKRILNSEKETLEAADAIMVYSPACEAHILTKYTIKGKVGVLPCVVSKTNVKNNPQPAIFNIGFIGSFLAWHKVEMLVRVFKDFHTTHNHARLQLIGYGMEWDKVKTLVNQLNLTEEVEMPGFVSEADLLNYKTQFSVALMPGSNWYGSPLKLFEYAQSNIPFIAPTTKTVVSIFQAEEHCLFIDPENEQESLLEMLNYSIENPAKMIEMANRAQDFVKENFEDAIYSKKLAEVLTTKP